MEWGRVVGLEGDTRGGDNIGGVHVRGIGEGMTGGLLQERRNLRVVHEGCLNASQGCPRRMPGLPVMDAS